MIEQTDFGKTSSGERVDLFTLRGGEGSVFKITNFGGRITEIHTRDRTGKIANINLGHDRLEPYTLPNDPYFGALIGRVGNRIAEGQFELDGRRYTLPRNNGRHTLHGGTVGFEKVIWNARPDSTADSTTLTLTHFSPDGDQGFPGNVDVEVVYTLDVHKAELRIDYTATTDALTPINLTNHAYFNLAGAGNGTILNHTLRIAADRYTAYDAELIPTGEITSVEGTALDFTSPAKIGDRIDEVVAASPGGYDTNFVLNSPGPTAAVARVAEPTTGRTMEVWTDQPGIQFYSGNFLNGTIAGLGGAYPKHGGFCLETQHFPDAVHHPEFPSILLRPGEIYRTWTVYKFGVKR